MENETFVAAGRAPANRFFGAITIILSLFGCLALGLLIAFSIFLSRARAQSEQARAYEVQARAARDYQANLVSALQTQNSQYQPQPPQYSIPYSTTYGTIPPAMMGSPGNSMPTPSPIPQATERLPTSALDAEVQRLAIELRSAKAEKRERLNQELVTKLTELFDVRQKSHVSQLVKLRGQVQKTQELIEKREKLKSQIIDRRVRELTGQPDELGWDPVAVYALSNQSTPSFVPQYGFPLGQYNPTLDNQVPSPNLPPNDMPNSYVPAVDLPPFVSPPIDSSSTEPSVVSRLEQVPLQPEPIVNIPFATDTALGVLPALSSTINDPSVVTKKDDFGITSATTPTSQKSFITIGFRLKQLSKELADENAIRQIPNPSRRAIQLQSAIDETRAVWDFEKLQFKNDLNLIDSEQKLVQRQLENAQESLDREIAQAKKGAISKADVSKAEDQRSEIERQLLQLSSRWAILKQSFDWMIEFEQSSLKRVETEVKTE